MASWYFEASLARPFGCDTPLKVCTTEDLICRLGLGRRDMKCVIKDVVPGGNGERAGFLKGDTIVRMNDYQGETYEDFMSYMGTQPKHLTTQIVKGKALGLSAIVSRAMNVVKNGSRFTVYGLAIRDKKRNLWHAHKRYSEFEKLHQEIGKATNAVLPGKTLFGKSDEKLILERMEGLNKYMDALLQNDAILEHPALEQFLARDQPLYSEDNIIESWDAEWAGAFLGKKSTEGDRDSMNSLRRKVMLESGKKSAALLGQASGKLEEEAQELGELEQKKNELKSRLMEVTGDLQAQIAVVEAEGRAMKDLLNSMDMYEIRVKGEFEKSNSHSNSENKKVAGRAVPRKRLEGEIVEITVKIAATKEGIVKLKESQVNIEDEGRIQKKALQLEIDQVARECQAQDRLLDHVQTAVTRLKKEIVDTKSSLEGLEGDTYSMNSYFSKMEEEAADLKGQLERETLTKEGLEAEEKSLQAQQDAVQAEHAAQLYEAEAMLGALREVADMRDGHAASLRGLRQMSKADAVLDQMVDGELARLRALRESDDSKQVECAAKREAILHAIKESETKFVEKLKEGRSSINGQQNSLDRLNEYFAKVKAELDFATTQLLKHNCERANLEECLRVLCQQLSMQEKQVSEIQKNIKTKQLEESAKNWALENKVHDLQSQFTDVQEQMEAEEQVLEGLQEYLAKTKQQNLDLDGTKADKARYQLLEHCTTTFGAELKAVTDERDVKKAALDELEAKETALKNELEEQSAKLSKEERDMSYKIEVDSRAMGIKRGYAENLSNDVKNSGVSVERVSVETASRVVPKPAVERLSEADEPEE